MFVPLRAELTLVHLPTRPPEAAAQSYGVFSAKAGLADGGAGQGTAFGGAVGNRRRCLRTRGHFQGQDT